LIDQGPLPLHDVEQIRVFLGAGEDLANLVHSEIQTTQEHDRTRCLNLGRGVMPIARFRVDV
jgi:hypothetical protein